MITETVERLGGFSLRLDDVPRQVADSLDFFEHLAFVPGRLDNVEDMTDAQVFAVTDFTGVIRRKLDAGESGLAVSGAGLAFWLGDEDAKAELFDELVIASGASFTTAVTACVPGALTVGTITALAGSPTTPGEIVLRYVTPRQALDYVVHDVFGARWRLNPDGSLDAGTHADLYREIGDYDQVPLIVRRSAVQGEDVNLRTVPGAAVLESNAEDYTTRTVVLGAPSMDGGGTLALGEDSTAAGSIPYKDLQGAKVAVERIIDLAQATDVDASGIAAQQLGRFDSIKTRAQLNIADYHVRGRFDAGDDVYIFDPSLGLEDSATVVDFMGRPITPATIETTGLTYGVTDRFSVLHRDKEGAWQDLTEWVRFEGPSGAVDIGTPQVGLSSATAAAGAQGRDSLAQRDPWHYVGDTGEPAYASPWQAEPAAGHRIVRFRLEPTGLVRIEGACETTSAVSSGSLIFTLPVGYRPLEEVRLPAAGGSTSSALNLRIRIKTDGDVEAWQIPTSTVVANFNIHGAFSVDTEASP